jgi:5-hydroxyisourate hydrolase-like protein (transthyretin family)
MRSLLLITVLSGHFWSACRASDGQHGLVLEGSVVDESARPIADVVVEVCGNADDPAAAASDADGRFRIELLHGRSHEMFLIARTGDGALKGFQYYDARPDDRLPDPLRIVVRPPRRFTVHVRDAAGQPVEGAQVEYGSANLSLIRTTTDASGRLPLLTTRDAPPQFIIAMKPGAGFGYAERTLPTDHVIELTLDGATAVSIEAADAQRRPIPGVVFAPRTIKKPGKTTAPNLSGSQSARATTDENGMPAIEWLPRKLEGEVPFVGGWYPDLYCPVPLIYTDQSPITDFNVQLLRYGTIAGRVLDGSGRPATGVTVKVSGVGAHRDEHYRKELRTDFEGRYEAVVPPRHGFIFAVIDDVFSATGRWWRGWTAGTRRR